MKKNIAIIASVMELGGCEKALISMLNMIPRNKYNITLFLKSREGELYKDIPNYINICIIPFSKENSINIAIENLRRGKIIKFIKSITYPIKLKKLGFYSQLNYITKLLPKIDFNYDVAISYGFPTHFQDWYTVNGISANKKIAWVHSDLSKIINDNNKNICEKMYSNYDNIFCVSEDAKNSFVSQFPKLNKKVSIFYNIISKQQIEVKGNIDVELDDNFEGIKILTVGRMSKEKGIDMIPTVISRLLEENYKVKWYCIGDGELRKNIEKEIYDKKIQDKLIILGSMSNPYPYMKKCDIYVQPSRYEAYCTTVAEARCFNKPIISTNVAGAEEQIKHGITGLIVNIDENEIYESIKLLAENKSLRYKFTENLKSETINTEKEMRKLYELID